MSSLKTRLLLEIEKTVWIPISIKIGYLLHEESRYSLGSLLETYLKERNFPKLQEISDIENNYVITKAHWTGYQYYYNLIEQKWDLAYYDKNWHGLPKERAETLFKQLINNWELLKC